ncbi:oligopeptide transporter 2-like [Lycium ferocissimum]|uniref:oligopeptide transporter 2-like n=1 Tax=Lycium ferocissimum TaxID=112874 RepID=UPI0028152CE4|nr:oligopeptide transporter 2-like [Lycium ferocissimum]
MEFGMTEKNRTVTEFEDEIPEDEQSPIEQVRLTVSNHDDPTLPVWTFRMWFLGILSCGILAFLNTFFSYRTQPLSISMITVQIAALPLGKIMARVLPTRKFKIGSWEFSFNPGPFNMKEHVLISIFANCGAGTAYAVSIVTIIKAFYLRNISFVAGWILVVTTQCLGYGWAGIMRKYVVEPAEMWWPGNMVLVSLFRALHEKDADGKSSRGKFFLVVLACSFIWYIVPGFLFPTLSNLSLLCLFYPKSVLAHQIGSGMKGLGILSFTFDWSVVASYLGSPLVCPLFAIINVIVGYVAVVYVMIPISYWGFNIYSARTFPLLSSHLFNAKGHKYDITTIVNDKFELDEVAYAKQGRINISTFFALTYGLNFAAVVATLTQVALFNGKEIYQRYQASHKIGKPDIHTKLMKKYPDIPGWWFHGMLVVSLALSLALCIVWEDEVQLPWWGLLFAAAVALIFTLPISIITATTNMTPGLNVITEYIIGLIIPGKPIANVCFKTFGYISMSQAVAFLSDFKLGHYMKVPPRSMFIVQLLGTLIAGTINMSVAWWLLTNIDNICQDQLLPVNSPWTCPGNRVFFDASVIWGLVGPKRMFLSEGNYSAQNWFFLGGLIAPVLVWLLHRAFPNQSWIKLINIPVLLGATAMMPPATPLNFNSWIFFGVLFNFFIYRYRKSWWQKYNYVLSAALDAGLAFMGVVIYFGLGDVKFSWWGTGGEYCDLATCPTAKGIAVEGCPLR